MSRDVVMLLQIALVDTLREECGIVPAGILGHSAGPCRSLQTIDMPEGKEL